MHYYALEHTMSRILLQKNERGEEMPISFMSVPLKKHELNYSLVQKQAFSMVKVVKYFWYYILHSHSLVYVPCTAVKSILTQQDVAVNNQATWVSKVQEFDVDIRPMKLVHGQGLYKLIEESEKGETYPNFLFFGLRDEWFSDIAYFLTYGRCPDHLKGKYRRSLQLRATKFVIIDYILYKRGLDDMFLRCVDAD